MQVAWVVYAIGGVLALVSLPLPVLRVPAFLVSEMRMIDVMENLLKDIVSGGYLASMGSLSDLPDSLIVVGVLGSFFLVVPGIFLLWLAARSRGALWFGRIGTMLLALMGPVLLVVMTLLNGDELLKESDWGLWLWMASVPVMSAAFWVVRAPLAVEMPPVGGVGSAELEAGAAND